MINTKTFFRIVSALVTMSFICFSSSALAEINIPLKNGEQQNQEDSGRKNRMPDRYILTEAIYDGGIISLPTIIDITDNAEICIATSDSIILSGMYPASLLAEGIYIGDVDFFTITVTLPNGKTYTGIYSI